MKRFARFETILFALIALTYVIASCNEKIKGNSTEVALNAESESIVSAEPKKPLSEDFKKYWYAGNAEITSYALEQARYGEIREGKAVLVYVTEPFVADKQVKADRSNPNNVPILKLNSTKKYLTGIYPYSIMGSSFYPVHDNQHAIKVTTSVQEWCGQVFTQLNNRDKFDISSFSYFESEGDKNLQLEKSILENELWNKIRIAPDRLPVGEQYIIPSLEYIRLRHKEIKAYKATVSLTKNGDLSAYEIDYPELQRTLVINFSTSFPHTIESWTETYKSGFGANAKSMTSKATKINTLKTAYWGQNGNDDVFLRDSLGL
ncbi:septum formation inhibitor Maf [Spongiimicrobium sp. 3-5]|uniref:septum formation inhibitor Maf n=1 Tax=Spongiimicrobium sp. 3-5 TaxID=3332596 RepID=UPI00397FFF25